MYEPDQMVMRSKAQNTNKQVIRFESFKLTLFSNYECIRHLLKIGEGNLHES